MLKRDIKYTDFNDQEVTETFYFNLTETEIVKLQFSEKEGFGEYLQRIVKEEDKKEIISLFERLVSQSYGVKSEDGRRFDKSPELSQQFLNSAAYNSLFMEILQNDNAAIAFITGVMPQSLAAQVEAETPKQRPPVTVLPGAASQIAPLIPPAPPTS